MASYEEATRRVDGRLVPAVGRWEFDVPNTFAGFVAPHLVFARVRGRIPGLSGWIEVSSQPEESRLEVVLDATTLTTDDEKRDQHLKSADFADVENHPKITFSSSSVEAFDDNWKVTGDLTIRGQTHSVNLDTWFLGATTDWGNVKALFRAEAVIDRYQWGMRWNRPLEWGGVAVGREVQLDIHAQAKLTQADDGESSAESRPARSV